MIMISVEKQNGRLWAVAGREEELLSILRYLEILLSMVIRPDLRFLKMFKCWVLFSYSFWDFFS